jgi:streptogramin lyase
MPRSMSLPTTAFSRPSALSGPSMLSGLLLLALAGCGSSAQPPAPLPSLPLPTSTALLPYDAADPGLPKPQMIAAGSDTSSVFVALTNLDASWAPAGPGLLARVALSTSSTTLVDMGGSDGHQCTNSGTVRNSGGLLLAACAGGYCFNTSVPCDTRGRAIVQVDPGTNQVLHLATAPTGTQPMSVAAAAQKIWAGDAASSSIFSIDRSTFALADGRDAAHPAIQLPCADAAAYVTDLLVTGDDLFALCASKNGSIVRLDAQTGAVKGSPATVGGSPQAMALMADGRIAVVNGTSDSLAIVSVSGTALLVDAHVHDYEAAGLQDVRALGGYLYTVASTSKTVQKLDPSRSDPTQRVVAEVYIGDGTGPYSILPLDDGHALVTALDAGTLVWVAW